MSVNGFKINGVVEKYDYSALDNIAIINSHITNSTIGDEKLSDIGVKASVKNIDPDLAPQINITGGVYYSSGNSYNSASIDAAYSRSRYIYLSKGTKLLISRIKAITSIAVLAVYDEEKTYHQEYSISGQGSSVELSPRVFVMPFAGYIRLSTTTSNVINTSVKNVTSYKELNLLVLGNSFSQDVYAYVPVILNELLPDHLITVGVCYISSAGPQTYLDAYFDNSAITFYSKWSPGTNAWVRYANGGASEKTLSDVLSNAEWNMVYFQSRGALNEETMMSMNITPARRLHRLVASIIQRPFSFFTGQWLTENNDNYNTMRNMMKYIKQNLGVCDVIPIGAAIAYARTNSTFAALGDSGNMLYDGQHQQAGLPNILSAYVIVEYILKAVGEVNKSVYNSSFYPTTENCYAINAAKENGAMTTPLPMTHGASVGVTEDNIHAAQEIAIMAIQNPDTIADCSNIIVSVPTSA